jgi:hypothetical protein
MNDDEQESKPEIRVQVVAHDGGEGSFLKKPPPSFADRASELGDSLNEVAGTLSGRLKELGRGARTGGTWTA